MINVIDLRELTGESSSWGFSDGSGRTTRIRIFFFIALVICFVSIIAGIWIAVDHWFNDETILDKWPGVALILQSAFIFASALLYRFNMPADYNPI